MWPDKTRHKLGGNMFFATRGRQSWLWVKLTTPLNHRGAIFVTGGRHISSVVSSASRRKDGHLSKSDYSLWTLLVHCHLNHGLPHSRLNCFVDDYSAFSFRRRTVRIKVCEIWFLHFHYPLLGATRPFPIKGIPNYRVTCFEVFHRKQYLSKLFKLELP